MAISEEEASKDAARFGNLFERLVDDLTGDDLANPEIKQAALRFKEVGDIICFAHFVAVQEVTVYGPAT